MARVSSAASGELARTQVFQPWFLEGVFDLLPVDMRARCALVGRQWWAVARLLKYWEHLDLRGLGDFVPQRLRGVVAMARDRVSGQSLLKSINLTDTLFYGSPSGGSMFDLMEFVPERNTARCLLLIEILKSSHAVEAFIACNSHWYSCTDIMLVFAGAPNLAAFQVDVRLSITELVSFLIGFSESFSRLSVRNMKVSEYRWSGDVNMQHAYAELLVFAEYQNALALMPCESLCIEDTDFRHHANVFDFLMTIVSVRRLRALKIENVKLTAACVTSLVRALSSPSLRVFHCYLNSIRTIPAEMLPSLANALRDSHITEFGFETGARRLAAHHSVAEGLLAALVGHPYLQEVLISLEIATEYCVHVVKAVAALIAANAPALKAVKLDWYFPADCPLPTVPLSTIYAALEQNTHLEALYLPWQPVFIEGDPDGTCNCDYSPLCYYGDAGGRVQLDFYD